MLNSFTIAVSIRRCWQPYSW